jgi:hypothetical protein
LIPAQEFRETRDWFLQHKRDPFLWLIILGPLTLAAINFWGLFVFPPSDAIRAVSQDFPSDHTRVAPKNLPTCNGQKYSFGYDFDVANDVGKIIGVGRVCRDIVNGGWVVDIDPK